MVSLMPSHWLGLVSRRLYRVKRWFELTEATWLAYSLFPEPDLLIPVAVALFPMPFLSPGVTVLALTRSGPHSTHDRKVWETIAVIVSNQQQERIPPGFGSAIPRFSDLSTTIPSSWIVF